MDIRIPTAQRLTYYAFVLAIWLPLLAVLCSPRLRPFAVSVTQDPTAFEAERNRLRAQTPLWNRAVAFYNDSLYALGVSGRPGAAVVGRGGWVFLGDIFNNNFSQAIGRRVLDDREVASWIDTLTLETQWLQMRGIPSAFVVAPAKWSIYPDRLPSWTARLQREHSLDRILAAGGTLPLIDVRAVLREARNHADTYSALNSHWTDYGAWVAWTDIAADLSRRVPALSSLRAPALGSVATGDGHNEFAGMLNISAQNEWTTYRLGEPLTGHVVVNADGSTLAQAGDAQTDLLDLPRMTRNEHARIRQRVLVMRDSSANSLSPFLQDAFEATYQVDHKLGQPDKWPNLVALVERFRPDFVLWVMTERYFNEPAGELDYWRAAENYDCAEPRPSGIDAAHAAVLSHDADGGKNILDLRDENARSLVIRLTVDAREDGTLSVQSADGVAISPGRINFSAGLNELFFKIDRVKPAERLALDPTPNVEVKAVEIRSGGCLADSSTARTEMVRTPSASSADDR